MPSPTTKPPQPPAAHAAPFALAGGAVGCLLIHGFSGDPSEMRALGEHLAGQGCTVRGVLLAGHGGSPDALRGTGWCDWLASAEAGFDELRRTCTTVTVVGFSLGGSLALALARRRRYERLVLLATPYAMAGGWRAQALPLARYVIPWFYPLEHADFSDPFLQRRVRQHTPDIDLHNPDVQAMLRRSVRIPMGALDELRRAIHHGRRVAGQVRLPTLLMHGRNDETISPEDAPRLLARLGSHEKQLVWWDDTGHQMLVMSPHRQEIYAQISSFATKLHRTKSHLPTQMP